MSPTQENEVNSTHGTNEGSSDPSHCHFVLIVKISQRKFYPLSSYFLLSGCASLRKEAVFTTPILEAK